MLTANLNGVNIANALAAGLTANDYQSGKSLCAAPNAALHQDPNRSNSRAGGQIKVSPASRECTFPFSGLF